MIGCLRTRVRRQPIFWLYFDFETILKFYNLAACLVDTQDRTGQAPDRSSSRTAHNDLPDRKDLIHVIIVLFMSMLFQQY